MIATVAVLDDSPVALKVVAKGIDGFNRESSHRLDYKLFSTPEEMFKNFDYDLALIDVELGSEGVTGFDVARKILRENSDTVVIMVSSDIPEDELAESLIPKCLFRVSEIFSRFWGLRSNLNRNVLQIFMRGAEFDGRRRRNENVQ